MNRKEEQKLWDTMLHNKPPRVKLDRVENYVGVGMPDVYLRTSGRATWIELKAPIAPKRPDTRLLGDKGLRQEQINWHLQSAQMYLPTYVLIRDDRKRLWVVKGKFAKGVNDMTAAELDQFGIRCQTWYVVFETFMGHRY